METPKIFLKPKKEASLLRQHPWVFSGAIREKEGNPNPGDWVAVHGNKGRLLAHGHYGDGGIAVRLLAWGEAIDEQSLFEEKISRAQRLRQRNNLPNKQTNAYRLVHAEGDDLPGLIIDIYKDAAVIECHSDGMYQRKDWIAESLLKILPGNLKTIYCKSPGERFEAKYLLGDTIETEILENGIRFRVNWLSGQKTGFFLDQKDNRKLLGTYASGKKVLNTFCYTGGFSLYALASEAKEVQSVDSSAGALEMLEENLKLNEMDISKHQSIKSDAKEFLRDMDEDFDIVVLDPPAFAKHIRSRHDAVQGYKRINAMAMRKIKAGGILFTFSCSQVIETKLFNDTVLAAALAANKKVRILHQMHQPPDHPINIYHPEGEYLKGLVLLVE